MENKRDIRIERLEKLKQAIIVNFTDKIDYNNRIDLYDTLLEKVFAGSFDDMFLSDYVDKNDKDIFELARKYNSLCFFEGDSIYWVDSVEGVYLSDLDLITIKLLDNYDFLLRIAKENGEDSLKQLVELQETEVFEDKIIVDYLRNSFVSDDILIDTIKAMSNPNGDYKDFSNEQKALLCLYPEGILYRVREDKKVESVPVSNLISKIKIALLGEDNGNFHLGDSLKHLSIDDFNEIIINMYDSNKKEANEEIKKIN